MDMPNHDLNKSNFLGIAPLIWAATCGQEQVARLPLEQKTINPDKLDRYLRRALSWAAWKGHLLPKGRRTLGTMFYPIIYRQMSDAQLDYTRT